MLDTSSLLPTLGSSWVFGHDPSFSPSMLLPCSKIRYYNRVLLHLNLHKPGFFTKFPIAGKIIYLFLTILPSFFQSLPDSTTSLSGTLETGCSSSRMEDPLWMLMFSVQVASCVGTSVSCLQRPFPCCKTQVRRGDGAAFIEPSKMMFLSGRSHLAGYRSYLALWSEKEPCFHHGLDETLRTDQY